MAPTHKNNGMPLGAALITGASSGIGAAFAWQLAARGHDLILVARRADKLQALAHELACAHHIRAEAVAADLAQPADLARLCDLAAAREDLAMLINNAGFGSGGLYYQAEAARQFDMIQVQVMAPAQLIRAALPGMVKRGAGGVINVASVAAFARVPTSAMYSSTKNWLVFFTRVLAVELAGSGVRVQALCPGFTVSGFHDTREYKDFDRKMVPAWMWMTSDAVVAESLRGLERNRVVCIPGIVNQIMVALLSLPPVAALARYYGRRRWRKPAVARSLA